ncbi:hypothetical protein SDC9_103750 [bioreactor metagenome]|uniref:Uncharacterized protein n=1 Tax=bioreactor metagenome TaxID=1076179 RepID=A0A645B191_9ZZZZ
MRLVVISMDPADIITSKAQIVLVREDARLPLTDEESLWDDDDDMKSLCKLHLQLSGGVECQDGFPGSGDHLHNTTAFVLQPGFNACALPCI